MEGRVGTTNDALSPLTTKCPVLTVTVTVLPEIVKSPGPHLRYDPFVAPMVPLVLVE
jgi:hypothetical protein